MPRIIAGAAKGRKLETPKGMNTRPTTDRIKETIFNVINFNIPGSVILDLFAGSGSLGIEALSRGAEHGVFCDLQRQTVKIIEQNISFCRFEQKAEVYCANYIKALEALHRKSIGFDLIFLDPPYDKGMLTDAIEKIFEYDLLNPDGIIVAEMSAEEKFDSEYYTLKKMGNYGQTKVAYLVNQKDA